MICYNRQWAPVGEDPIDVTCLECGNTFDHITDEEEGHTYSHRCGALIELPDGKKTFCILPTHTGKCLGHGAKSPKPKAPKIEPEPTRVYTDGGCRGDLGGWGWWCQSDDQTNYGFEEKTTNQRMELYAALDAIDHYLDVPQLIIVSDSAYLVNCMNEKWYERWQANGWRNAKGQPIANQDLWEGILKFMRENPRIKFEKVRGHSGDQGNDKADELATQGMVDYARKLDSKKIYARIDDLRKKLHLHSFIYYHLSENVISDAEWDALAQELVRLHRKHPEYADEGYLPQYFHNWTGDTGMHLPRSYDIQQMADELLKES